MSSFYKSISTKKGFAVLVDPDRQTEHQLDQLVHSFKKSPPDVILVGGSLVFKPVDQTVAYLKAHTEIPVYLFPGDATQLSDRADGIFFLSLISGRNPEYLIGNHVIAAPHLKRSGIDVIPTGYMLIENGHSTSVEYVSNTKPIPFGKTDLAVATALAGELLGMRMIYFEAGSGAAKTVGIEMISAIRKAVSLPIVVGGGIRTVEDAQNVYHAGADMIVIGTQLEEFPDQISEFASLRNRMNNG